jgi:integrase
VSPTAIIFPASQTLSQALWARCGAHRPDDLVFAGRAGQLIHHSTVLRVVQKAGEEAGVRGVTTHMLRHTAATMLFTNEANAVQVQRALGHHSPAFTLATYVHLLDEDMFEPDFWDDFGQPEGGNTVATQPTETDRNDLPLEAVASP